MRRIISLLLFTVIMMATMCIIADASNNSYTFQKENIEYTVEINDSSISEQKKQTIANALVGSTESEVMTINIWCDLFGHDYQYTTASVIQHKAKVYTPRCKRQTYDVTYCEDCDYTEQTLKSTTYVNCCPEE